MALASGARQGSADCLGVFLDDHQQNARRTVRLAAVLLPIAKSSGRNTESGREFSLTELQTPADRLNVEFVRDVDPIGGTIGLAACDRAAFFRRRDQPFSETAHLRLRCKPAILVRTDAR